MPVSSGISDCFGQDAGNYAVLMKTGTHRDVKKTLHQLQITPHSVGRFRLFAAGKKHRGRFRASPSVPEKPWVSQNGLSGDVFCSGRECDKCRVLAYNNVSPGKSRDIGMITRLGRWRALC